MYTEVHENVTSTEELLDPDISKETERRLREGKLVIVTVTVSTCTYRAIQYIRKSPAVAAIPAFATHPNSIRPVHLNLPPRPIPHEDHASTVATKQNGDAELTLPSAITPPNRP